MIDIEIYPKATTQKYSLEDLATLELVGDYVRLELYPEFDGTKSWAELQDYIQPAVEAYANFFRELGFDANEHRVCAEAKVPMKEYRNIVSSSKFYDLLDNAQALNLYCISTAKL